MAKDPQYLNTRTWCLCDSLIVPLTQPIHSLSVKRKTPSSADMINIIVNTVGILQCTMHCLDGGTVLQQLHNVIDGENDAWDDKG